MHHRWLDDFARDAAAGRAGRQSLRSERKHLFRRDITVVAVEGVGGHGGFGLIVADGVVIVIERANS